MDPVTVIGAASASVQLLDAAIKTSRSAYVFFQSLKNANEEIRMLRGILEETESLMRDLKTYMLDVQRSPSSTLCHLVQPDSIVRIAQQFSEDMELLGKALPATISPSTREKIKFVLTKKSLKELIQRLEERKISAMMALGVIGRYKPLGKMLRPHLTPAGWAISSYETKSIPPSRCRRCGCQSKGVIGSVGDKYNDIGRQAQTTSDAQIQRLDCIRTSLDGLTLSQNAASGTMLGKIDNVLAQNQTLHDLHTASVSAIQKLLEPSPHLVTAPTGDTAHMPHSGSVSRPNLLTSNRMLSTRRITTEDLDIIGKIVRAELRQQLEPLSGRLEDLKELVDSVANAVSGHTQLLSGDEKESSLRAELSTSSSHTIMNMARYQQDINDDNLASGRGNAVHAPPRKGEAMLYSIKYYVDSVIGRIRVHIQAYRQRGLLAHKRGQYFHLKIIILPRPWLSSRGLSVTGSTGPNAHGHYGLCPSILPFRVILDSSPMGVMLKDVLWKDDLSAFQKLLFDGAITLRDVHESGYNILQVSIFIGALNIVEYLVREPDPDAQRLLEDTHNNRSSFWFLHIHSICFGATRKPPRARSAVPGIFQLLKEKFGFPSGGFALGGFAWFVLVEFLKDPMCKQYNEEYLIEHIKMYKEYGVIFDPYGWVRAEDMVCRERVLDLYLRAGGDANGLDDTGRPALLVAMDLAWSYKSKSEEGDEGHDTEGDEGHDTEGGLENATKRKICLLTPLIRAGADIYYIEVENGIEDAKTITDMAFDSGIEDAWFNALENCGFDIDEVRDESDRRLNAVKKLHGAKRSGVDVSVVIDQPDSSGLRYRGGRVSVEVDV
ncbi:hypothetical protein CONLIGDRAFT_665094 [Coniochaeta ligniaria NRRL 30616]|uniref:Fungal N-terminal domain-containing protein n=1 Tax=Coniochaeta ligniaria NRRL 30616 TaxID=1408157 RepID=A0A1J7JLM4_9PEZI|nr:hypothetical protein CONLIGDRAFT_665094 [Coniochaeta ligniaria NRRL 30616]